MDTFAAMNPASKSETYSSTMPGASSSLVAATRESAPGGVAVDAELVRRMRSRDERALGAFYDRWFPVVHGVVSRMLESPDDVEDVVEEAFWQAWRQAERFDVERGSVQTWLLTIARSRALDRLRARRRLREEPLVDSSDAEADTSAPTSAAPSDPLADAEHAERSQIVRAALADLPSEQREALELGYFGGLSQSEIAEQTGLPLGTIKTRMRLALQKLRERLSPLREAVT
jgi:RNA polymerase sigma-70 factor, ECF subfamily